MARMYVLGTTLIFCAASFAQSTPGAKSGAAAGVTQQSTTTARETGTGVATGKKATASGSVGVVAPRDHASGQATGRRTLEPTKVEVPNVSAAPQESVMTPGSHHLKQEGIVHRDLAAREAQSGQATGKREKKVDVISVEHEVKSPRDSATGQASGKRVNKVDSFTIKQGVNSPRDSATGQASGKRQHKPAVAASTDFEQSTTTARETGSGVATGKRQHGAVTIRKEMDTSPAADERKTRGKMTGANSNPMYKDDGKSGVNPMYESKDSKRVQSGLNATGSAVASGAAVVKTKTKSNQSNDRVATGDLDGDGVPDKVSKGDAGATESQKATINTTRSNIKHQRAAEMGDGSVTPGPSTGTYDPAAVKVTKSRSNIQNNRVAAGDVNGDGKADATAQPSATPAKKADPYGNITWESTGTGSAKPKK